MLELYLKIVRLYEILKIINFMFTTLIKNRIQRVKRITKNITMVRVLFFIEIRDDILGKYCLKMHYCYTYRIIEFVFVSTAVTIHYHSHGRLYINRNTEQ